VHDFVCFKEIDQPAASIVWCSTRESMQWGVGLSRAQFLVAILTVEYQSEELGPQICRSGNSISPTVSKNQPNLSLSLSPIRSKTNRTFQNSTESPSSSDSLNIQPDLSKLNRISLALRFAQHQQNISQQPIQTPPQKSGVSDLT